MAEASCNCKSYGTVGTPIVRLQRSVSMRIHLSLVGLRGDVNQSPRRPLKTADVGAMLLSIEDVGVLWSEAQKPPHMPIFSGHFQDRSTSCTIGHYGCTS